MRITTFLASTIIMGLVAIGVPAITHAVGLRSGQEVLVASGETVNSSFYAASNSVNIAGTINGDVFCVGQNIQISGTVNGDVLCAGQTVIISAHVNGNIRAAGQSVYVRGPTAGSVSIAGQSVEFSNDSAIGGDATIAGQSVNMSGRVGRDLTAIANQLFMNGMVTRDLTTSVTDLKLDNGATVGGSVEYTSPHSLSRNGHVSIAGNVIHHQRAKPSTKTHQNNWAPRIGFMIYWLIAFSAIALLFVLLFPQYFEVVTNRAMKSPLKALLVGLGVSIIVPPLLLVLLLTIIGAPLALLLGIIWVIINILAVVISAYFAGRIILRSRAMNAVAVMLIGVLAVTVIVYLPVIGFIAMLLFIWFGLGMFILQVFQMPKPMYHIQPVGEK